MHYYVRIHKNIQNQKKAPPLRSLLLKDEFIREEWDIPASTPIFDNFLTRNDGNVKLGEFQQNFIRNIFNRTSLTEKGVVFRG